MSIAYSPGPQVIVAVPPTHGGMVGYNVVDTDSYLQQALQGIMQNAQNYTSWTLQDWIDNFTKQAQQRCAAYGTSCSDSPEALGNKYGNIAWNLMQANPQNVPTNIVSAPVPQTINSVQQPISTVVQPDGIFKIKSPDSVQVIVPTAINTVQPTTVPLPTQVAIPVATNNSQQTVANTGGTPVAPATDFLSTLQNIQLPFGITGMEAVLGLAAIAIFGMMSSGGGGGSKRGRG